MAMGQGRPAEPAPADLDRDYLARLAEQVGDEALAELLADGLVEVTDRLERLAEAAEAGDGEALRRIAHDLTSVAGHMGLARLSLAAAACQKTLRGDPEVEPARAAHPVLEAGPGACAGLRGWLAASAR